MRYVGGFNSYNVEMVACEKKSANGIEIKIDSIVRARIVLSALFIPVFDLPTLINYTQT